MDTPTKQAGSSPEDQKPGSPAKAESVQPAGGGSRMAVMAVVVVLVLAGVGYGIYAYMNKQKEAAKPAARVKVGVLLALSGGSSSMGYGSLKGIQLAKKQLGADNIELIQADGKCDPKTAPDAMKYLIEQKVVAIIGENCSSASVAVKDQAAAAKILMLSPSASSPKLSLEDDYFFRTVPSDIGQGNFLAEAMYAAGIRKAGVFFTAEPYGSAINDVFKARFESLGGKVVVAASAESSVIDVKTQVNALKAAKPEGIAIVTNSTVSSTAAMKLGREMGITVPYYGGDNLYDNTIITNGGTAAEGLHVVSFPTGTKSFKQALLNEYHVAEQLYAAPEAYDAFKAIYLAVQKGATTGEQFKSILPNISFEGASATIKFDKYGEIPYENYKYDLLEVKDGAFSIVAQ